MIKSKSTNVYRLTLNENEIIAALEALEYQNNTHGLDSDAKSVLVKFKKYAIEFNYGTKAPAYVATGIRKEATVNLGSLGASEEEVLIATHGREVIDDAKIEQFNYEMQYGTVLPYQRFIGKTMHEVHEEENTLYVRETLGITDKNVVTDVAVREVEVPVVPTLDSATSFKERIIAEHHSK